MAELIKTKINKKSPKLHECSPQRCSFKDENSKDVALQCRKCHRAVHYKRSRLPSYQNPIMLVFQRAALSMPKLYKSITTSPRRAGIIKKRHNRNQ